MCSRQCQTLANRKAGVLYERQRLTSMAHYGTNHPRQSKIVHEKVRRTVMKRYGVTCTFHQGKNFNSPEACLKRHENKKKNGSYALAAQKCHATMKRNGSYGRSSKQEDMLYDVLIEKFGVDNVQRQVLVNKWPIDFYVKNLDTYIQYDSEYWHGLDRDVEVIKEFQHVRDKAIFRNFLSDQEKDVWFNDKKLELIKLTFGRTRVSREMLRDKLEAILIERHEKATR